MNGEVGGKVSHLVKEKGVDVFSGGVLDSCKSFGRAELSLRTATPKINGLRHALTRIFLLTSISSSTMCTQPSDPFVEPFYSLKKAFTRLLSPIPDSAGVTIINIACPIPAPPTLITPSSATRAADIAMLVTSRYFLIFLPQSEH